MSRKEAIEILKDLWRTKYSTYLEADIRKALEMAIQALEQDPKTGHWIEQIDHEENCRTLICSNCDRPALHDGDSIWKHKFCPHCGAEMEEGE